jgi:excisionase family DNA binding protein
MQNVTDPLDDAPEAYVSPSAVADYLSVPQRWVLDKARDGVLPSHRLPGSNRFRFLLSEVGAVMHAPGEAA